jgi:hypothetical protein
MGLRYAETVRRPALPGPTVETWVQTASGKSNEWSLRLALAPISKASIPSLGRVCSELTALVSSCNSLRTAPGDLDEITAGGMKSMMTCGWRPVVAAFTERSWAHPPRRAFDGSVAIISFRLTTEVLGSRRAER